MTVNLLPIALALWKWLRVKFVFRKPIPDPPKPEKRCLLIVEDDPFDVELLQSYLMQCGCSCDVARFAELAQEMITTKFYRVAFVDLRLPKMPGQRLIQIIRLHHPKTHIVIVSGEVSDMNDLMAGQYFGLIRKSVTLQSVQDLLSTVKFD